NIKVGYVGNLYKGKGIEVIASINEKVKNDVEFHIIGGKKKDIEYWKNKIKSKNIFFYGFIPQNKLSNYINSLDICLLPNQMDLFLSGVGNISSYTSPLKLFDYMSHKKAIIASDIKVLREVLNDKNSILVKCDDFEGWINAIEKLKTPLLRKKIEDQALKDFHTYTWSNRVKKIFK
ncbi:glycosyltransferase, partial [Candidatus Pelagibacter bacterium]|nr:glycosyltransferase [Candidatus Pelagibacter bacterium]